MFRLRLECNFDDGRTAELESCGEDLCKLKESVPEVLDNLLETLGKEDCYVDAIVEKDGEYLDSDSDMYYSYENGFEDEDDDSCEYNGLIHRVARFEKVSLEQWLSSKKKISTEDIRVWKEDLKTPVRKTSGSAGYDFVAYEDITIEPHATLVFPTGIKCMIENGYVLELYPRSSLGFKYNLTLDNTVGIIDSDFYNNEDNEGNISVKMTNHSDEKIVIKKGQGYMQGIFKQFFITYDDEATAKRTGGIGSTNK